MLLNLKHSATQESFKDSNPLLNCNVNHCMINLKNSIMLNYNLSGDNAAFFLLLLSVLKSS